MLSSNTKEEAISAVNTLSKVTAAAQIVYTIYDRVTGLYYSEKDRARLANLKQLYRESLNTKNSPEFWELDSNYCPTHRIKHQNWSLHIKQLKESKIGIGHFHYESSLIAEYAANYLTERAKRLAGKGSSGDLLEQFMSEWIHFALNDLPTFDFDEISIKKLQERFRYIEQVQKHEDLFQFGKVSRNNNKFTAIENIKQQLKTCIKKANKESQRRCARDEFNVCNDNTAALLLASIRILYYARATDVHLEPLDIKSYINPYGGYVGEKAALLYPKLKATHSGAILYEVISYSGLRAFGTTESENLLFEDLSYFDKNLNPVIPEWDARLSDLPYWVPHEDEKLHLEHFQLFSQSILRVAKLKTLIDEGYDLTGKVGDMWAYGDKYGKKSLEALLFLIEEELKILMSRLENLYQFHNEARLAYNLKNKIDAAKGVNPNFNRVDEQKEAIDKFYTAVDTAAKSMRKQMQKFPEDASQQINNKKKTFYRAIADYLRLFHPHKTECYQELEESLLEGDEKSLGSSTPFNLRLIQNSTHVYLDGSDIFIPKKGSLPAKNWKVGNSYASWMSGFCIYHYADLGKYQEQAKLFQRTLVTAKSTREVNAAHVSLTNQLTILLQQVELERPRWRFKLGLWLIKTKGWPFNRDADQFAETLKDTLNNMFNLTNSAASKALVKLNRGSTSNNTYLIEEKDYLKTTIAGMDSQKTIENLLTQFSAKENNTNKSSSRDATVQSTSLPFQTSRSFSNKSLSRDLTYSGNISVDEFKENNVSTALASTAKQSRSV